MTTVRIEKRRFLGTETSLVATVGVIGASIPFVLSWQPSARAKMAGGPVEAGIRNLEPGRMITVKWAESRSGFSGELNETLKV